LVGVLLAATEASTCSNWSSGYAVGYRVAGDGTFGPSGDGSDWHLFLPELGLSIYMMDFDIFAAGRAESVRGMLIGLGSE
jgi:hypothetical protein